MNFLLSSRTIGCLLLSSVTVLVGCGDSQVASDSTVQVDEHDEHDEHAGDAPDTFAEAFEALTAMKTEICKAFAAGTPDEAHDSLHKVGQLLEDLPDLAAKVEGVSADRLSKVEAAVEKLFDGFTKLDGTMHDGPEVDVAELEKQLSAAVGELEKAVQ
ncbi:MAG: hypothetical protein AB8B50_00500 [Pirellulaceae bacterium]